MIMPRICVEYICFHCGCQGMTCFPEKNKKDKIDLQGDEVQLPDESFRCPVCGSPVQTRTVGVEV